jgi:hypothetical protein
MKKKKPHALNKVEAEHHVETRKSGRKSPRRPSFPVIRIEVVLVTLIVVAIFVCGIQFPLYMFRGIAPCFMMAVMGFFFFKYLLYDRCSK